MERIEGQVKEIKNSTIKEFGKEKTPTTKRYFDKAAKRMSEILNRSQCYDNYEGFVKSYKKFATPSLFEGMRFSDYITENSSQKNALEGVVNYYNSREINYLKGINLILFGNYGTGKTMLMSILCQMLSESYFSCRFFNAVDMICRIKDSFSPSSKSSTTELLDSYKGVDFLFIDDIDKIKPTEYVQELMYSIVNTRIENERPIIISANHSLEELDEQFFHEATISRIAARNKSRIIKFTHENMRLK